MAQLVELKLVSEAGTPQPWPGVESLVQVNLVGTVTPVWIGVSADGLTNQAYPVATPLATITASWPRVYQGIEAVVNGQTNLYNNGEEDYNRRVAACCISPQTTDSPEESPGPISQQMFFGVDFTQFGACAAEQVPYYVSGDADPDNMEGEQLYNDAELTEPAGPSGQYIVVNGNLYQLGDGIVGEFIMPCDELAHILFTFDFDDPGQEGEFRLLSNETMQMFINWGDGSPEEEVNGADVIPTHVYAEAGQYPVRVRFGTITVPWNTMEIVNKPLAAFGFHPEYGNSIGVQTIQLQNCGLTDDAIDWASFETASINNLILGNNALTSAIIPQLPQGIIGLNLSDNNLGALVLANFPPNTYQLVLNNAGVTSFDTTGAAQEMYELQLSNNSLEAFTLPSDLFILINVYLDGNSLPEADIDAVLVGLDAAGLETGILNLSGQTPSTPPGVAGAAAQANLEGKSWTVTVDV